MTVQDKEMAQSRRQELQQREDKTFGQSQLLQRAKVAAGVMQRLRQLPLEQRSPALMGAGEYLSQFDIDVSQYAGQPLTDDVLDQELAVTQGMINNPQQLTAKLQEMKQLTAIIEPYLDENGQFDAARAPAQAKAAAIELGIASRAGSTTVQERLGQDQGLTQGVAQSQATIAGAKEEAKLEQELDFRSRIAEDVELAKVRAKARGENLNAVQEAEAQLPGVRDVVGKLKVLADEATFTLPGRAFNTVAKQFGISTDGSTALSSMIAIIDNQVLPLLKPTFGAAFTVQEGESLKKALADPNSTPESRKAQLDAFIAQFERNIDSKRRLSEIRGQPEIQSSNQPTLDDLVNQYAD